MYRTSGQAFGASTDLARVATADTQPTLPSTDADIASHRACQGGCHCTATVPLASGAAGEFLTASCRSVIEVVAHIKANMDDPMLVETGIRTLRIIAARNAVNFKEVLDAKGIEVIIESLARHKHISSLQREGCRSLERTMRTDGGTKHGPSTLTESFFQGLRVIVIMDAIRHHPLTTDVLEDAIKALGTLALDSHHQKVIGNQGGIEMLVSTMRRHPLRVVMQVLGCWALTNLVTNVANQQKIGADPAKRELVVTTITAAMRAHPEKCSVLEQGCRALCNLAYHPSNTEAIASFGGIACVLRAMTQHLENRNIQHHGCAVLCNGARDRSSLTVARFGGLENVMVAMDTYTFDADLMEVAVKAMASINWFVDTEVQNKARELKGIAIVRTVRNAHPNHTVIQSTCNEILARIDAPQVPSLEDEDLYN
eukprot:CAMPEP_0173088324 /NCGR_PEP_ID=MMETSP1102-20130122/24846_1 /TAXON_ID=49646 /ORGANISM="Geminigera sp., Strain Caron Lab Isolate" /LENGTH=426 /DNA_ID=CAMNT_0013971165 /DNA_START=469 /DNA_END=1749 /DNA_ORIENTATION=-